MATVLKQYKSRMVYFKKFFILAIFFVCTLDKAVSASNYILVLGDSMSAGYGIPKGTGWVDLLAKRLQDTKITHWQVINASISGETTAGGLNRLPSLLNRYRPNLVILQLGSNDVLRGLALQQMKNNIQTLVTKSKNAGAKIIFLGMVVPVNYGLTINQELINFSKSLAKLYGISVLDYLLQNIADVKNAEQYFQNDGLHPNSLAQPKILDNVWPLVYPIITQ
ncbi:MAG: arylesterase [Gammaproteobacteria bacterium]|nr:arylesterase [Gammaproteobacteria bacterium]